MDTVQCTLLNSGYYLTLYSPWLLQVQPPNPRRQPVHQALPAPAQALGGGRLRQGVRQLQVGQGIAGGEGAEGELGGIGAGGE